ncbi:MAG: hypothetical protein MPK62_05565 [Alphaproteobacteria bacterium]|nr:hypothetical protein [Alphaproteobacteria bacterium]
MSLAFPPDGAIAAQKVTRANAYKTRRETPARPAAVSDACRPERPRAVSRREYTGSRAVKSIGGSPSISASRTTKNRRRFSDFPRRVAGISRQNRVKTANFLSI